MKFHASYQERIIREEKGEGGGNNMKFHCSGYRVEGTRNVQGPPAEASASFSGRTSCLGICGRGRSRFKGRQQ